jgi:hypothetical protein
MDNISQSRGGNMALNSGVLSSSATQLVVGELITCILDGRFILVSPGNYNIGYAGPDVYSQNGVERNGGFTGQVGGSTRLYGVFTDGFAFSFEPGKIVNSAQLAAGVAPLEFPAAKRDKVCIGAIRVALVNGATFVPGTTSMTADGVTTSLIDLAMVPAEPLRA